MFSVFQPNQCGENRHKFVKCFGVTKSAFFAEKSFSQKIPPRSAKELSWIGQMFSPCPSAGFLPGSLDHHWPPLNLPGQSLGHLASGSKGQLLPRHCVWLANTWQNIPTRIHRSLWIPRLREGPGVTEAPRSVGSSAQHRRGEAGSGAGHLEAIVPLSYVVSVPRTPALHPWITSG